MQDSSSGVAEWDAAIKNSSVEFGGEVLTKNLTPPLKAVVFDDLSRDVDDAFWLMLYSCLAPLTMNSVEEYARVLFNFMLNLRSSKDFNIGDKKINDILRGVDGFKRYVRLFFVLL